MGLMTRIAKNLPIIDASKSKQFMEFSNSHRLSDEFLLECKEASRLFKFNQRSHEK